MISLKQFMDWATVSKKISNVNFTELRQRLMLAYVAMMVTILGVSATSLYIFFERSMRRQLDHELTTLVQAAAPSLDTIKEKGAGDLDKDLAWEELFSRQQQSLQWYGVDGQKLGEVGTFFPEASLPEELFESNASRQLDFFQDEAKIRSVTIAVYTDEVQDNSLKLKGYIRASESTEEFHNALYQLRLGLLLGGSTAIFLITVSSIYLTQQAFKPTLRNFQQLKQFAADASHELGTPLTKISFATEILLSYPEQILDTAGQKKLEIISRATEQTKSLLNDLLFLARTDTTSSLSHAEKFEIRIDRLLQYLAESFIAIASKKEINLQFDLDYSLIVEGDESQLNRLFSNLLSNAIKYTENKGTVSFSLEKSKHYAVITVQDTGIGIATENLPYVFQRFWRDERVRRQKKEGSGLGLAIAHTIVQKHQGKITVESEIGVGTCFRVYLPIAKVKAVEY